MSDFNKIIRTNFDDLFLSSGFVVDKEEKNFVSYTSDGPSYRFGFDPYSNEKSMSVNFNRFSKISPDGFVCENFTLEEFLKIKSEAIFREATMDQIIDLWAKNILGYFNEHRTYLLGKDNVFFSALSDFAYRKAVEYNKTLGIKIPDKPNN